MLLVFISFFLLAVSLDSACDISKAGVVSEREAAPGCGDDERQCDCLLPTWWSVPSAGGRKRHIFLGAVADNKQSVLLDAWAASLKGPWTSTVGRAAVDVHVVTMNRSLVSDRAAAWSKVCMLRRALALDEPSSTVQPCTDSEPWGEEGSQRYFDWAFVVDVDTVFHHPPDQVLAALLHMFPDSDILLPHDPPTWQCERLCTGFVGVANTAVGRSLLDTWWQRGATDNSGTFLRVHPWEQYPLNTMAREQSEVRWGRLPYCLVNGECDEAGAPSRSLVSHCMGATTQVRLGALRAEAERRARHTVLVVGKEPDDGAAAIVDRLAALPDLLVYTFPNASHPGVTNVAPAARIVIAFDPVDALFVLQPILDTWLPPPGAPTRQVIVEAGHLVTTDRLCRTSLSSWASNWPSDTGTQVVHLPMHDRGLGLAIAQSLAAAGVHP
jgi:hypothetical protein